MFIYLFALALVFLITFAVLIVSAWRENADSEYVKKLGVVLHIAPPVLMPTVYKKSLRKRVILADLFLVAGIASIILAAAVR